MSKILTTTTAIMILGLAATGAAEARDGHGYYGGHTGYLGPISGYVPQVSTAPQFNNPGPQISVPQPGNAVDQISPLMGAGQPDALGIK